MKKICIIGAGNMGGAIAGGIYRNGIIPPENITVTAKTGATIDRIKSLYPGISTSLDNARAAEGADLVILAVKPWQLKDVADEIRPVLDYGKCTVASVVARTSFKELEEMFRKDGNRKPCDGIPGLLRIIPNTAIALGKSTTFIAGYGVDKDVDEEVTGIFSKMGEVVRIPEEMMAAGTALASCGIAYALKYIDAAIKGGIKAGFSQEDARRIVINTVKGAVALLESGGTMPQTEIDKVTTPGGYTFRGLTAMEENGFTEAVIKGLDSSM